MALNKFQQARAQMESALGEPMLKSVRASPAGEAAREWSSRGSPLWRPYLTVNGQPHTRAPRRCS